MFGGVNKDFTWSQGMNQGPSAMNAPPMSHEAALGMVGKPAGFSHTGSIDSDLDAYYGADVSGRGGDYSIYGNNFAMGGSGGFNGQSSIDGVSAINPQAGQANELDSFRRYEDAAYNDAMRRLQPQMDQDDRRFDQAMISRGHTPGSGDAYSAAYRDKEMAQAEALENAAFGAMQFGLGAQNQSFQQDHARSALANALLQAQWQKELGWGNIGLGQANLAQRGQQFNDQLDFNYDTFYDTLGQRNYEFDSGQDFDYWDRGNYWDFAQDRADASDYFGSWDRNYGAQQDFMDQVMRLFGGSPGNTGVSAPYNPQPGSPYDWSWMF